MNIVTIKPSAQNNLAAHLAEGAKNKAQSAAARKVAIDDLTARLSGLMAKSPEFNYVYSGQLSPREQTEIFGINLQSDISYVTIRKAAGVIEIGVMAATLDYRGYSVEDIVTMAALDVEAADWRAAMQADLVIQLGDRYLQKSAKLFDFNWKVADPEGYAAWQEECVALRAEYNDARDDNKVTYFWWQDCREKLAAFRVLTPFEKPEVLS